MPRIQPYMLIGGFALVTAVVAGVALGTMLGLSAGDGTYLTILLLAVIGWLTGRNARRKDADSP